MKAYKQIIEAAKHELFAEMPVEYIEQFKEHRFMANVSRFAIQGFVVVLMDACSLIFYLFKYRASGVFLPAHISVHVLKMLLMGLLGIYFYRRTKTGPDFRRFLDRNNAVIYGLLHFILEFVLFVSGPQDLGAFIRLLAVPFIVSSIPILKQGKCLSVQLFIYLIYYFYFPMATPYGFSADPYGFFINLWVVVFSCANLVGFTVYSWYVNSFVASMKAKEAQAALSELNGQLDFFSKHDALTGLFNRRGFQQYLDSTWGSYDPQTTTVTVMMFDIDYFKRYNDRFGHLAGDDCLYQVTHVISQQQLGDDFIIARYGGEEFIAVAYNQDHDHMVELANEIRKKIVMLKMDHPDSDVSRYVTVSMGVATQCMAELKSYSTLVDWADECLYFAKRSGRNRLIHTCGRRGDYKDIYGYSLSASQDQKDTKREFDAEYTQRLLKDIGANCSFVYNVHLGQLRFSASAVELFDLPSCMSFEGLDNLSDQLAVAPGDRKTFIHIISKCLDNCEPSFSMEIHIAKRGQISSPVSIGGQCAYGADGRVELCFGSIISITKMVEYNHFLRQQSMSNGVTLLPNRNKLNADIRAVLQQKDSFGYVLFLDVKNFKGINSYYSHSIGDKVLREAAHQLTRLASDYLPVYNYDVDQFVVVAKGASREEASQLMEDVYQHFNDHPNMVDGLDLHVEFSMVGVEFRGGETDFDQLFLDLDMATQMIKYHHDGRQYDFFDGKNKEHYLEGVNLSHALFKAAENDFEGFMLYYQPIMDAQSGRCVGAEALLRWRDENGDIVPPGKVIPVLEQTELMIPVEEWIINTACRQCAQWIREGAGPDFFVNINLSSAKLGRSATYDEIIALIRSHGLELKNVTLEVTESATMIGRKNAIDTLASLQEQGVRIAIDDFGTGYSSLSYLHSLPANEIKIDRSFVREIGANDSAREFLSSIVGMSKSMGFVVCIEGVETDEQKKILDAQRIDYLQGFLFGMPTPPEQFMSAFFQK